VDAVKTGMLTNASIVRAVSGKIKEYGIENFHIFTSERIDTHDTHGTGCTYASAITTGLAQGLFLLDAIELAKKYVTLAIRHSLCLGKGHGPINHMAFVFQKQGSGDRGCMR